MAGQSLQDVCSSPLTYKLRPEERLRLRKLAAEVGVGPSTFAADAVRRAIGTERRRAAPQVPFAITLAVRDATGQLGSVGNLLNQLTKRVHLGGFPEDGELTAIRDRLASIDAKLAQVLS